MTPPAMSADMELNREALEAAFDVLWPLQQWESEETLCREATKAAITAYLAAFPPPDAGKIEPVAWRTDIFESLPNGKLTRLILDASEVGEMDHDWQPLYSSQAIASLEREVAGLKAHAEYIEKWCVPISDDGKSVFFDGMGDVDLDFHNERLARAEAAEAREASLREALEGCASALDALAEAARKAKNKATWATALLIANAARIALARSLTGAGEMKLLEASDLLPCPKCQSTDLEVNANVIACMVCDHHGPDHGIRPDGTRAPEFMCDWRWAIADWNEAARTALNERGGES